MAIKDENLDFRELTEDFQNRFLIMEETLRGQRDQIDELLNRQPPTYDIITQTESMVFTKDVGPDKTTFFLKDRNNPALLRDMNEGIEESDNYCWIVGDYVYDDGAWKSEKSYGCFTKTTYVGGWEGDDGQNDARWSLRGGPCNAKTDCEAWSNANDIPSEPPFYPDSASDADTSKSTSGDEDSSISRSESSSESSTAEQVDYCADGDSKCSGTDCSFGQTYVAVTLDYDTCNDWLEYYMEKMSEDCENSDNGTWKHCGWKNYMSCMWDGDVYRFNVDSCCCELGDCDPYVGEISCGTTSKYGSVTYTNTTNCPTAINAKFISGIGNAYCGACRMDVTWSGGSWSHSSASPNDLVSIYESPPGAIHPLLPGESITMTMTQIMAIGSYGALKIAKSDTRLLCRAVDVEPW